MNTRFIVLGVGCAVLTAWAQAGGLSTNLLEKAQLKQLDKNKNNILDYKEIETLPKAQCDAALDAYDINSDGEITAAELERVPRTKEDMEKEAKKQQLAKKPAQKQQQAAPKPQEQKKPGKKKKPAPPKPAK